jgi:hypothetical protein
MTSIHCSLPRFVVLCVMLTALASDVSRAQSFYMNNSLQYVHTDDAAGMTIDHEIGFNLNLAEWVAIGPSFEFFYYAASGVTTHTLEGNINLTFSKQIGKLIPYLGFTGGITEVLPSDKGVCLCATAGSAAVVNDNVALFLQARYYRYTNSTDLGRVLTQMGVTYTF